MEERHFDTDLMSVLVRPGWTMPDVAKLFIKIIYPERLLDSLAGTEADEHQESFGYSTLETIEVYYNDETVKSDRAGFLHAVVCSSTPLSLQRFLPRSYHVDPSLMPYTHAYTAHYPLS